MRSEDLPTPVGRVAGLRPGRASPGHPATGPEGPPDGPRVSASRRSAAAAALLAAVLAGCADGTGPTGGGYGGPDLGPMASLNGSRPFPSDNPWNRIVSGDPVDPGSEALLAACGPGNLSAAFGTARDGVPFGIPYVVVAGDQPQVPVAFDEADVSDPGPYPIPLEPPIEGGPGGSGERRVLVIDRDHWTLWELRDARARDGGASWTARSGAFFDLLSNALRPDGWSSADAAGLPVFPGLVRYDEVAELGEIRHALRFTCPVSRRAYVPPARRWAGGSADPSLPPMGMRVRLRADYDFSGLPDQAQVILRALQRHGAFLADHGPAWALSGAPDPRWDEAALAALATVPASALEVLRMEGVVAP